MAGLGGLFRGPLLLYLAKCDQSGELSTTADYYVLLLSLPRV